MAKPVLGHPSQTAAALALREQGMRPSQIGRMLDIPTDHAANLIRLGKRHRKCATGTPVERFVLHRDTTVPLTAAAAARGLTMWQLAAKLLTTIAADRLIDAILDDGVMTGAPRSGPSEAGEEKNDGGILRADRIQMDDLDAGVVRAAGEAAPDAAANRAGRSGVAPVSPNAAAPEDRSRGDA